VLRSTVILAFVGLLGACGSDDATPPESGSGEFPWSVEQGKTDVFGRSLVGAADPYIPNPDLVADPVGSEARLAADMKARRDLAWEITFKALEPVPLVGLANQLNARPACPAGVSNRDLDRCASHDEAACGAATSGEVPDICTWGGTSCSPKCDNLTLPNGQEIPRIPRWETWYGVEDLNRIFQHAYSRLSEDERRARAPFSDDLIGESFQINNTEIDRSNRWPLRRYTDAIEGLFGCDLTRLSGEADEDFDARCAMARQSQFSGSAAAGGGIARLMYSPAMVLHLMRNYAEILECKDKPLTGTWCDNGPCVEPDDNFSTCFTSEFPADAGHPWENSTDTENGISGLPRAGGTVIIKATWARVGFGFELPAFDTDADALRRRLAPGARALWEPTGDRVYSGDYPGMDDIYTIKTANGGLYRLTGLHIMTKELRHWTWITLWWSDKPDEDFGADRPEYFKRLPGVWGNYKMCIAVDYVERDGQVLDRYADLPSLQAALAATEPTVGAPSWCSNPYIEHEAGNARTNCIGCHQHAGSTFDEGLSGQLLPFDLAAVIANEGQNLTAGNRYPANGRLKRRNMFATDYSWAFSRLDDLTELIRTEVEFSGAQDGEWVRINSLLTPGGSVSNGEAIFSETSAEQSCTDCHGAQGEGGFGPAFTQLFNQKTDWQMMHTILNGRGSMPGWGDRLTDEQLKDLFAYLRATHSQN